MNQTIITAIQNRSILEFTYEGHHRVVEPHSYGLSASRKEVIRCYQIGGSSVANSVPSWKIMDVDQIVGLFVTSRHFVRPRAGYRKGDRRLSAIFCEI